MASTICWTSACRTCASKSLSSYFLGGNAIPWYMLGVSNASGMYDISGTMWMVYLLFVYVTHRRLQPWCPQCRHGGGRLIAPTGPNPLSSGR